MSKTVIVDYESGNLFSVFHACKLLGLDPLISQNPDDLENAEAVILPGVGAFGDAMKHLHNSGMADAMKAYISSDRPFLGICLGLQLLFEESEEFGATKGLGLIEGTVRRFEFDKPSIKVPHVGWNQVMKPQGQLWKGTFMNDIKENEYMYFVHSYYVEPSHKEDILAVTDYEGKVFCSAILKKNIFATQFHPEKSGNAGMNILKEFATLIVNG